MGKSYTTAELIKIYNKCQKEVEEKGVSVRRAYEMHGHDRSTFKKAEQAANGELVGIDLIRAEATTIYSQILEDYERTKREHPRWTRPQICAEIGIKETRHSTALAFMRRHNIRAEEPKETGLFRGYYSVWTKHEDTQQYMKCAGWFSAKRDALKFVDNRLFGCLKVQIVCPKGKAVA